MPTPAAVLIDASRKLSAAVSRLEFSGEVSHVYNPLEYAGDGWESYLELAAAGTKRAVLLGMNPGPFGMAQTGVPFGEIEAVRDWMGLHPEIHQPAVVHPKRPIEGLACSRSEVSGRRLWGLMAGRFGSAESFFADHFVANYCPLVFMAESGRNVTPDKLRASERKALFSLCDEHLRATVFALDPPFVIGVGKFAEKRIRSALQSDTGRIVGSILHPSPASPAANRGWAEPATRQLRELGVWS